MNSIECMAKVNTEVNFRKKKNKNFYLLGHSMGGMIVQEMTGLS